MKDMIFGYIIGWLIKIEDALRKDADDITEEQYSKIMLELDRVRAALAHCKYGKPNGNNLAPNSGHQPSCDGNCIATRGTIPCSIAAYQDANSVNEDLKLEGIEKDCDDAFREIMDECSYNPDMIDELANDLIAEITRTRND